MHAGTNDANKLYAVIGLGKTGLSCIRFLASQGIPVAVTDSRVHPPFADILTEEYPNVSQYLGKFDVELLKQATHLVISPGVSLQALPMAELLANGIKPMSDIELFAQAAQAPIIAITGTNGKSTVTTLIGEMAKCAQRYVLIGGNLGLPALELLALPVPEYYILELSSFQLETTYSMQPAVATILNISSDHMDRYQSFEDYRRVKHRIYKWAQAIVTNRDDALTQATYHQSVTNFGLGKPSKGEFGIQEIDKATYLSEGEALLLSTSELKLTGRQNWGNALAALAIGKIMNLPMQAMVQALKEFSGLDHRCQWVRELKGVAWFDDSKATNVGACLAAINGLGTAIKGKIILIAGGQAKQANFTALSQPIAQYVRHLIVFGEDSDQLCQAFKHQIPTTLVKNLAQAVERSRSYANVGDIVLLSPACASFDMFDNYAHRGSVFAELVHKLSP